VAPIPSAVPPRNVRRVTWFRQASQEDIAAYSGPSQRGDIFNHLIVNHLIVNHLIVNHLIVNHQIVNHQIAGDKRCAARINSA
jgi:hypothetical protein